MPDSIKINICGHADEDPRFRWSQNYEISNYRCGECEANDRIPDTAPLAGQGQAMLHELRQITNNMRNLFQNQVLPLFPRFDALQLPLNVLHLVGENERIVNILAQPGNVRFWKIRESLGLRGIENLNLFGNFASWDIANVLILQTCLERARATSLRTVEELARIVIVLEYLENHAMQNPPANAQIPVNLNIPNDQVVNDDDNDMDDEADNNSDGQAEGDFE